MILPFRDVSRLHNIAQREMDCGAFVVHLESFQIPFFYILWMNKIKFIIGFFEILVSNFFILRLQHAFTWFCIYKKVQTISALKPIWKLIILFFHGIRFCTFPLKSDFKVQIILQAAKKICVKISCPYVYQLVEKLRKNWIIDGCQLSFHNFIFLHLKL